MSLRDLEELQGELHELDPELHGRTDLSNKRRVVRALEIAMSGAAGEIPRSQLPGWILKPLVFVTNWDRAVLRQRIANRLQARLDAGLVDEVRGLRDQGLSWERLDDLGMEYREVAAYLRGQKSFEAMQADLLHGIHQLAKRQDTWFRGMEKRGLKTVAIGPEATADEILRRF